MKNLLYILPLFLFFTNCEDPVDINSPFEKPTVVVDAWLNNKQETQFIKLNESVDYFSRSLPPAITGAAVQVCRSASNDCIEFTETSPGVYAWTPETGTSIGEAGDGFELNILLEGDTLSAATVMARTAVIDSIALETDGSGDNIDTLASIYARDIPGRGDTYWVRTWKNDTLIAGIQVVFDAAFDPGTELDGTYFISPLRDITPVDEDDNIISYTSGDEIYSEVYGLSYSAWLFLNIANEQADNTGLFAVPVSNSPGNISSSKGATILGVFNVGEVASISKQVE